ncbi:MAG: GNAT family N-acetyltransferase [Chloroflexota bacterium]
MAPFTIELSPAPRTNDVQLLEQGLTGHAFAQAGVAPPEPLALFLRDDAGRVVGGLSGRFWDGVLDISTLWVHEDFRGEGYGRRLIEAAETEGIKRHCEVAHLRTFDYQAPGFYLRVGYEEYHVEPDWPRGHTRHYFRKRLTPPSGE